MTYKLKEKWIHTLENTPYYASLLDFIEADQWHEALNGTLDFGTGGMRGHLGPGENRINHLTIRKVVFSYAKTLKQNDLIIIGYDTRHFSYEFALDCAKVLIDHGIRVKVFKYPRPTPECSFAIRHFNAQGGIMITASHNPKTDNGIKLYDENGCQFTPDKVLLIQEHFKSITNLFDLEILGNFAHRMDWIDEDFDDIYLMTIQTLTYNPTDAKVSILYSPLQGTGYRIMPRVFDGKNVTLDVLDIQMSQDPNFTNTPCLNPEKRESFEGLLKENENHDLLVASDPDCDRLGVMVHHQNSYHLLSGNQLGILFLDYIAKFSKKKTIINTIVTTDYTKKLVDHYKLNHIQTLTGFKYIGETIETIDNDDFLFGFEESNGYLFGDFVRDKDAVQAMWVLAEMTQYYKTHNKTLLDALHDLHLQFGPWFDAQISIPMDAHEIEDVMNTLRDQPNIIDYLKDTPLPKENVLKLYFDKGWIVLRPSGTEPLCKVYYYAEDKKTLDALILETNYLLQKKDQRHG